MTTATDLPPAAQRILDSLPGDLPAPEVQNRGLLVVILTWAKPGIAYARFTIYGHSMMSILQYEGGALGSDEWYFSGREPLTDRLPDSLVALLRRVLGVPERPPTKEEMLAKCERWKLTDRELAELEA